jgi:hypothetical protein
MEARTYLPERPEVSALRRKNDEIVKKIRKLRWIGMHNDALEMERNLSKSVYAEVVRSGPIDTD